VGHLAPFESTDSPDEEFYRFKMEKRFRIRYKFKFEFVICRKLTKAGSSHEFVTLGVTVIWEWAHWALGWGSTVK
jgi:hypothetical protein